PEYPKDKMEAITDELGYTDNLVVEGEQFHLWVIEGPEQIRKRFPADKAGLNVVFTGDLQPYRERKVRILNGAHTSMVPLGLLMGIETVKEAVEHPELGSFVREIIEEEIIPTLSLSEEELSSFASSVLDRFKNPFIKHYLSSIALNSLSKFGTRVLPTIAKYIEIKGTCPDRLCTAFAGLIAFYRGIWGSQDLPVQDNQQWQQDMSALWTQYDNGESTLADLVKTCLGYTEIWSEDLNTWPGLAHEVTQKLEVLTKYDVRKLLSVDDAISDVS
ncbi:MAG: tagaturonate reductase, partial [Cyclobacteriaceae bacterium]|nr:tagaturonate reductase [Cyclobacteriaceae bacterium HetDA_MAG_MS6]